MMGFWIAAEAADFHYGKLRALKQEFCVFEAFLCDQSIGARVKL
jgi:hypothetical protein